MRVGQIVNLINKHLADEFCSVAELTSYMDRVIDDINTRLNSKFPTVSEVIAAAGGTTDPDYNVFPDKYIRSVLVVGAAYKYYITDEEGNATAQQYGAEYNQNLFYMERDYSFSIPEIYRESEQGFVTNPDSEVGVWFPNANIY
jgi:hypothetical protein